MGVQGHLDNLRTATGVKDPTSLRLQQQLISRARDLQQEHIYNPATRDHRLNRRSVKDVRTTIVDELKTQIQIELMQWVYTQPEDRYQVLPVDSCE